MFQTFQPPHHAARLPSRTVRLLAIVIVFAMGAAFAIPAPAAAQVGASVSGTIFDGDGGALANAELILKKRVNGSLWSYHETLTDEEGGFSFSGLEPGTWEVVARLDGYRTNRTSLALSAGESKTTDITLLSLTERAYTGTVRSNEDTEPIAGATITVRSHRGDDGETERTTTSAEDGTFRITLFAQENEITITKSGYSTYRDWIYQASGVIERDIYLHVVPPQTATVTGTVVDADGNPVQAYVNIWPVYEPYCCESDAEPEPATASDEAVMKPSRSASYDGYHHNNYNSTVTAEDGTFTMKAYPGKVQIQANRQGYLVASEQATLEENGTTTLTFTLVKLPERTVTIQGIVTDQATGEPIQGASVSVFVPAAGDRAWASTDENGHYTFTVRPGYTILEVDHWGHCCIAYETRAVAVGDSGGSDEASPAIMPAPSPRDGTKYFPKSQVFTTEDGETRTLNVALDAKPKPQTTLVGYVLDAETGEALAGAHISLQNHATGEWGEASTDQNGSYKFLAYGGYHTVRIWIDGHLPYSTNLVLPGEGSKRADFEVTAGDEAQEGWWSPDGRTDHGYPEPMPMYDDGYAQESTTASSSKGGGMVSDSDSRSASSPGGAQSYEGSGGGLPAYDPADKGATFGTGAVGESPVSPLFVLVLAIGALAVAVGLRRDE